MLEVPSQTVESPTDENVKAPTASVFQELIQGRTPIFAAADSLVDVFTVPPCAGLAVSPEVDELVLGFLLGGRHTCIQCRGHVTAIVGVVDAVLLSPVRLVTAAAPCAKSAPNGSVSAWPCSSRGGDSRPDR